MLALHILYTILGISMLVIIHEAGHYLVARWSGMRVTRFSIGFGPTLIRYQPKDSPTVFQVCAIPLLAYVAIAGMNPAEEVDDDDPELYPNKGWFPRAATIVAGPVANYLTASAIVFALAVTGWPNFRPTEPMVVSDVAPGSAAAAAGLLPGDQIVEVAGIPIKNVEDLKQQTEPRAGKSTAYVVVREGQRLPAFSITPEDNNGKGMLGVAAQNERIFVPKSFGESATLAVVYPAQITYQQLVGFAGMIQAGSAEGLSGPVGMGKMLVQGAERGLFDFASLLMLLSVALGMFNLFPLPALDGGRLVFLAYELITRRRPNQRFEATVHTVGMIALLGLMVLVTVRDIVG